MIVWDIVRVSPLAALQLDSFVCGCVYVLRQPDMPALDPALGQHVSHRAYQRMHIIWRVAPLPTPNLVDERFRESRRARRGQRRREAVGRRIDGADIEVRNAHARRHAPKALLVIESAREHVEERFRRGVDCQRRCRAAPRQRSDELHEHRTTLRYGPQLRK